jgi:hypothetical protein
VCKLLLDAGADVNSQNDVSSFKVEVAKEEVVSADINLKQTTYETVLFFITTNALV